LLARDDTHSCPDLVLMEIPEQSRCGGKLARCIPLSFARN
jgi:hypothetical protein